MESECEKFNDQRATALGIAASSINQQSTPEFHEVAPAETPLPPHFCVNSLFLV